MMNSINFRRFLPVDLCVRNQCDYHANISSRGSNRKLVHAKLQLPSIELLSVQLEAFIFLVERLDVFSKLEATFTASSGNLVSSGDVETRILRDTCARNVIA
jgi:hypothetical protein